MRERGAKVITSDASYTPKVTTWGVFDRPRDISATYGGGRKLQPEDSIMSKEEKEAYDKRLKEKLAKLRQDSGLDIDPEVQAECEELTMQGAREAQYAITNVNCKYCYLYFIIIILLYYVIIIIIIISRQINTRAIC
jgi:dsDNA-binding SOS-regulon protein